jgi:hypothetical protein
VTWLRLLLVKPETLFDTLDGLRSIAGDKYVCMQEGTQSEWLCEVLTAHAKQVVVTQLKRAPIGALHARWTRSAVETARASSPSTA